MDHGERANPMPSNPPLGGVGSGQVFFCEQLSALPHSSKPHSSNDAAAFAPNWTDVGDPFNRSGGPDSTGIHSNAASGSYAEASEYDAIANLVGAGPNNIFDHLEEFWRYDIDVTFNASNADATLPTFYNNDLYSYEPGTWNFIPDGNSHEVFASTFGGVNTSAVFEAQAPVTYNDPGAIQHTAGSGYLDFATPHVAAETNYRNGMTFNSVPAHPLHNAIHSYQYPTHAQPLNAYQRPFRERTRVWAQTPPTPSTHSQGPPPSPIPPPPTHSPRPLSPPTLPRLRQVPLPLPHLHQHLHPQKRHGPPRPQAQRRRQSVRMLGSRLHLQWQTGLSAQ